MKLTARLDSDIKGLRRYFEKLFLVLEEAQAEDQAAPIKGYDIDSDESQETHHHFKQFIKPDMLLNIYSLVDFWMNMVCEYHQKSNHLPLTSRDIKGQGDLDARHKYLTVYAGINLGAVESSYRHLDRLRKVRNTFIHGGGHVPKNMAVEFAAIQGIRLEMSLIVIDDSFIWDSLDHAKTYLWAAVVA